jgi:hypothetical protein
VLEKSGLEFGLSSGGATRCFHELSTLTSYSIQHKQGANKDDFRESAIYSYAIYYIA